MLTLVTVDHACETRVDQEAFESKETCQCSSVTDLTLALWESWAAAKSSALRVGIRRAEAILVLAAIVGIVGSVVLYRH